MTIKRILLPFCDAGGLEPIAEAAFAVGQLLSAQVRALLAQQLQITLPVNEETTPPELIRIAMERANRRRADKLAEARQVFEACAKRHPHVEPQFASAEGDVADLVSHAARLADISVLGGGLRFAADGWEDVREPALLGSGRPILLVPPGGIDERHFDRVVIAWKDSIEAARAIAAAHPFLLLAKEVHLIAIAEDAETIISLQDAEQYLQLHHAEVRSEILEPSPKNVGELLIAGAEAKGGALLVMGAYSHWRWQERVFGGVTAHVLRETRVPVLMAH
jgi:nucleotide-binding universal stress UspA family protein